MRPARCSPATAREHCISFIALHFKPHLQRSLECGQAIAGHQLLIPLEPQAAPGAAAAGEAMMGAQGRWLVRAASHAAAAPCARARSTLRALLPAAPMQPSQPLCMQTSHPRLMLMARFHTVSMLPMRSVLPCQSMMLLTRARACGSPAAAGAASAVAAVKRCGPAPAAGAGSRAAWRPRLLRLLRLRPARPARPAVRHRSAAVQQSRQHRRAWLTRVPVIWHLGAGVAQVAQHGPALRQAEAAVLQARGRRTQAGINAPGWLAGSPRASALLGGISSAAAQPRLQVLACSQRHCRALPPLSPPSLPLPSFYLHPTRRSPAARAPCPAG